MYNRQYTQALTKKKLLGIYAWDQYTAFDRGDIVEYNQVLYQLVGTPRVYTTEVAYTKTPKQCNCDMGVSPKHWIHGCHCSHDRYELKAVPTVRSYLDPENDTAWVQLTFALDGNVSRMVDEKLKRHFNRTAEDVVIEAYDLTGKPINLRGDIQWD